MDEMYRMLGREHEADLEREAVKFRRAAEVRRSRSAPAVALDEAGGRKRIRIRLVPARVAALVGRAVS